MRIFLNFRKNYIYGVREIIKNLSSKTIFSALLLVLMGLSAGGAVEEQKPFVYDDHGQRDPLWPLVSPSGAILNYDSEFLVSDLALEGIMAGEDGQNFAIINGRVLKKDDLIGQFAVEEIGDNRIILKKGKQKIELKLKKEE